MRMKDKKAEQVAAKQRHKNQLKAQRQTAPSLEREEPKKEVKPTILIVCEGKNTEPSYFNQFRLSSAVVKSVGEGYNTVSLVERAVELAKRNNYDQVWCVFDKDDFSGFNEAIQLAKKNNFGVGYSNQAFEYWIFLHFNNHQGGGMHRSDYHDKINDMLKPYGVSYDGKGCKKITEDIFELLEGIDNKTKQPRVKLAIERAERNYEQFDHLDPAKEESSTTVFRLVRELLKYR